MSGLSEKMMAATSKPDARPALLVLEDGAAFRGLSCGCEGEAFGEICFNTSLEGYLEVVTDPSYAGQIVAMTYPQIGNYGVNREDAQSDRPALRGLVVRDMCPTPSSWRSEMSLPAYLKAEGVVAIEGVDTRALVRHVRERGAMRAAISTVDTDADSLLEKVRASQPLVGVNLVKTVSCTKPFAFGPADLPGGKSFAFETPPEARYRVVVYDCGVKRAILESLVRMGAELLVMPWDTPAEDALACDPDGVFVSNGPGDPDAVAGTYRQVGKLLGRVPVFGICMGHQMICKAVGGRMEKLKFGHHGGNQPVVNLRTGRVEITAQNHGFSVAFPSLGRELSADVVDNDWYGRIQLTHENLNDSTPEGIAFRDIRAFSVQYHPEANPGPTDSRYLFAAFARLMDGRDDYLDIDIARGRLDGWRLS